MRFSANLSMLAAVLMVGACALPEIETFRAPDAANLFTGRSVSNFRDKVLPPVTAADLVDSSGNCAGAYVPAPSGDQPGQNNVSLRQAGVPMIPASIALEMTECDVVKRIGVPARVEIGANERRERTAALTYIGGERPGIYAFTDGRLRSMEMGAEAPVAHKPAKKPARPSQRAAQPNRVSTQ
ncbi:MAG: hypothetical protein NTV56_08050 [Alphaproteobacteria bacterium]|nr:hypothetical protein [Alphaproteobacteria bacterium]